MPVGKRLLPILIPPLHDSRQLACCLFAAVNRGEGQLQQNLVLVFQSFVEIFADRPPKMISQVLNAG
jgi:hypothetical protein